MSFHHVDFLVIGSGLSGLNFALNAAKYGSVLIITKEKAVSGSTFYAQGGVAAAIGFYDSAEKHKIDTLKAGAGLCDEKAVDILVNDGIDRIHDLINLGMVFSHDDSGSIDLTKEGGHSEKRIIHFKDQTGKYIEEFLIDLVQKNASIKILENSIAVDLITEHHIKSNHLKNAENCYGAYVLDTVKEEIFPILANFTFLATGGAGRVYPFSTNPREITGDGVAMAYRAGCSIRNMEFVQFHPTVLYSECDPAFLISEAVRGEGARLMNKRGEYFMQKYHPLKDLAPRDIVSRAIDSELKSSGDKFVYLDTRIVGKENLQKRFPHIYNTLKDKFNILADEMPVPVVPGAHYLCGGVLTDLNAKTDLNYLYAAGETASSGIHGANRLASNSLLETLVFSKRALDDILGRYNAKRSDFDSFNEIPSWNHEGTTNFSEWGIIGHLKEEIQNIMWNYIGIIRSIPRLERALKIIDVIFEDIKDYYYKAILNREVLELRNLVLCAQLIIRSALSRSESRGLHFIAGIPETRDPSRNDTILKPFQEN
jgi:L-aspartate oxidase